MVSFEKDEGKVHADLVWAFLLSFDDHEGGIDMLDKTYQEKVLEVEPFGIESIPKEERHGHPRQQFTIWFAINLNIVTWFTGFIGVETGLSVKLAIIAILIGNLAGAAFLALTSILGPKLGQSLVAGNQKIFGKPGMVGLAFLNLLNNIGWFTVNLVLAVMALQKILPLGYHSSLILIAAVTLVIAFYGYNFIHSLAHWMSIIIGIVFVMMTVLSLKNLPAIMGAAPAAAGGFNLRMFILTIAICFSYQISYCPIGSDYSRYLPEQTSAKKVWLSSFLGCLSVCVWLEILGALTATLAMQVNSNPIDFMARLMGMFTIPALITVILSILPVNAMAIYSGGLASLAMGIPMKRWVTVITVGGFGALAGSFGGRNLADSYKNFLFLLSYWIAPWLGVLLSDFSCRSGSLCKGNPSTGWPGIVAFICGVAISVPFMSSILYVGPIAKHYLGGADISYFLSMAVSALIYRGVLRFKDSAIRVRTLAETKKEI